jgi:hypothetical protein
MIPVRRVASVISRFATPCKPSKRYLSIVFRVLIDIGIPLGSAAFCALVQAPFCLNASQAEAVRCAGDRVESVAYAAPQAPKNNARNFAQRAPFARAVFDGDIDVQSVDRRGGGVKR